MSFVSWVPLLLHLDRGHQPLSVEVSGRGFEEEHQAGGRSLTCSWGGKGNRNIHCLTAFPQPARLGAQSLHCSQATGLSAERLQEGKGDSEDWTGYMSSARFGDSLTAVHHLITTRRKGVFVLPPLWSQRLLCALNGVIFKPQHIRLQCFRFM